VSASLSFGPSGCERSSDVGEDSVSISLHDGLRSGRRSVEP
jgi:hypothetical protein